MFDYGKLSKMEMIWSWGCHDAHACIENIMRAGTPHPLYKILSIRVVRGYLLIRQLNSSGRLIWLCSLCNNYLIFFRPPLFSLLSLFYFYLLYVMCHLLVVYR